MQASELFNQPNTILLDGGMGTMLQAAGMKLGTLGMLLMSLVNGLCMGFGV